MQRKAINFVPSQEARPTFQQVIHIANFSAFHRNIWFFLRKKSQGDRFQECDVTFIALCHLPWTYARLSAR